MNKNKPTWETYLSNNGSGFYIVDNRADNHYGPFKTREFAEFFNLLAFGSPRSVNVKEEAAVGIVFCENKPVNQVHPRIIFASNSKFALWINDIYGKPLTVGLALDLARASGAKGYKSFINWMINGSRINGTHLASVSASW